MAGDRPNDRRFTPPGPVMGGDRPQEKRSTPNPKPTPRGKNWAATHSIFVPPVFTGGKPPPAPTPVPYKKGGAPRPPAGELKDLVAQSLERRKFSLGLISPPKPPTFMAPGAHNLLEPGNIDIQHRPHVKNPDGSVSTVRSATFTLPNGNVVVLPTVINGKVELDNQKVFEHYLQTGEHLGIFKDLVSAEAYSRALHQEQATQLPEATQPIAGNALDAVPNPAVEALLPMLQMTPPELVGRQKALLEHRKQLIHDAPGLSPRERMQLVGEVNDAYKQGTTPGAGITPGMIGDAAVSLGTGVADWGREVAAVPGEMLGLAASGGGPVSRTSAVPPGLQRAANVAGTAEPAVRPIGSTAEYLASEKGQEQIWGKSLTNLVRHGDLPGSWRDSAGLGIGLAALLPMGKLPKLALILARARGTGKAVETAALIKSEIAYHVTTIEQKVAAGTATDADLKMLDNLHQGNAQIDAFLSTVKTPSQRGKGKLVGPNPFHFNEAEQAANLKRRQNIRPLKWGNRRRVDENGIPYVGRITPEEAVARMEHATPDAAQRAHDAAFYQHVGPKLGALMEDKEIMAWLASQVGASPSRGVLDLLRVLDAVAQGREIPESGPGSIGLAAHAMRDILAGKTGLSKGAAAKISDFIDSALGSPTRNWVGHEPSGGAPAVADRWGGRSAGLVDAAGVKQMKERFGATVKADVGEGLTPLQYEQVAKFYHDMTDVMNARHFDGRSDWIPAEVQAMDWAAIQRYWGVPPEDLAYAISANTRRVNLELTHGIHGLGNDLTIAQRAQVAREMEQPLAESASKAGLRVAYVEHGTSAYESSQNVSMHIGILAGPEHNAAVKSWINDLATALDQYEVWATKPGTSGGSVRIALRITGEGLDDFATQTRFWDALRAEAPDLVGYAPFTRADGEKGITIVTGHVYKNGKSAEEVAARYKAAIDKAEQDTGLSLTYDSQSTSILKGKGSSGDLSGTRSGAAGRAGVDRPSDPEGLRAKLEAAIARARDAGSRVAHEEQGSFNLGGFRRRRAPAAEVAPPPGETRGPKTLNETVQGALEGAPESIVAQGQAYSEERAIRAKAAMKAYYDAGGGRAGSDAALGKLRGALPVIDWNGFTELNPETVEHMIRHVFEESDLQFYEMVRTVAGIDRAVSGQAPQKNQLALIERVFGKKTADALSDRENRTFLRKLYDLGLRIWNVPRTIMASFDLSAPFRQGLVAGSRHPVLFAKNFKPMLRAFGSERMSNAIMEDILTRPNYENGRYLKAKLDIQDVHGHGVGSGGHEEQFPGSLVDPLPGIKHSARAYSTFLNKMRVDMFDRMVAIAEERGKNVDDPNFLRALGEMVNTSTGRGRIPGAHGEDAAQFLNTFLFSPRLLASRFQILNPNYYVRLYRQDPFVAAQALRSAGQTLAGISTMAFLASSIPGAKVGLNPLSADFGKVRIGDTRIDFAGGFQPLIVLYSRLYAKKSVSSTTGETQDINGGFGTQTRPDMVYRFFQSKMSPTMRLMWERAAGQTYIGDPVTWKGQLWSMAPLNLQGTYDAYKNDGPALAGASVALGSVGFGMGSYPDSVVKPPAKTWVADLKAGRKTPYAIEWLVLQRKESSLAAHGHHEESVRYRNLAMDVHAAVEIPGYAPRGVAGLNGWLHDWNESLKARGKKELPLITQDEYDAMVETVKDARKKVAEARG